MPISYQEIRTDRQWKAATGLSAEQFSKLLPLFKQTYESLFGEDLEADTASKNGSKAVFTSYGELLFFGLYSFKSGLSYDLLGLSFGLSSSNAYEKQSIVIRVLESSLEEAGYLPKRGFSSEEELKTFLAKETVVLLDATEQRVQRPAGKDEQKADYSGKKKPTR